jgi:protocatechuate 3,4-dioxygenase beta subunit
LTFDSNRREFLRGCVQGAVLLISHPLLGVVSAISLTPTPSNDEGPYYKPGAPVRANLIEPNDHGLPVSVSGKIVDTEGKPISGATLDIWHADANGEYDLEGFHHRAKVIADRSGEYHFDTVFPGNYGTRAKHIHYKITAGGHEPLITQLYFETDSFFEGNPDKNLAKDPIVLHRELIRPVSIQASKKEILHFVYFPICLQKL